MPVAPRQAKIRKAFNEWILRHKHLSGTREDKWVEYRRIKTRLHLAAPLAPAPLLEEIKNTLDIVAERVLVQQQQQQQQPRDSNNDQTDASRPSKKRKIAHSYNTAKEVNTAIAELRAKKGWLNSNTLESISSLLQQSFPSHIIGRVDCLGASLKEPILSALHSKDSKRGGFISNTAPAKGKGYHWIALLIDFEQKTLMVVDSSTSPSPSHLDKSGSYLKKIEKQFSSSSYDISHRFLGVQHDSHSCGIWAIEILQSWLFEGIFNAALLPREGEIKDALRERWAERIQLRLLPHVAIDVSD